MSTNNGQNLWQSFCLDRCFHDYLEKETCYIMSWLLKLSLHSHTILLTTVKVLVTQSCSTLCHPMDCSPPGSYVHGILQARKQEWVAIPFSRIFPTQGLNPGLLHCRQILYHLSYQRSQSKSVFAYPKVSKISPMFSSRRSVIYI